MVSPALFPAFLKDVPALCGYASSPDAAIGVCDSAAVYRPRDPRAGELFALVEDNFDQLERVWDERYEKQYGFWRPIIRHVVEQYMDCGDLRCRRPRSTPATSGEMFGTRAHLKNNYLYRMDAAKLGIYGNSKDEAMYPVYKVDAAGQPLDGSKQFVPCGGQMTLY